VSPEKNRMKKGFGEDTCFGRHYRNCMVLPQMGKHYLLMIWEVIGGDGVDRGTDFDFGGLAVLEIVAQQSKSEQSGRLNEGGAGVSLHDRAIDRRTERI
jgi:hypothetical protein